MLDIKFIRENTDKVKQAAKDKNIEVDIDKLLILDEKRRELQQEVDSYREERNKVSDQIAGEKDSSKKEALISQMQVQKEKSQKLESEAKKVGEEYLTIMYQVPTVPSDDTPVAKDESGNVEIYRSQEPPKFDFVPKSHIELGESLDLIDIEQGANVSGYRGYFLKNEAVMLQMGFLMYALQKAISKGYTPMIPPTLVKDFFLQGTGYFSGQHHNPDIDEIYKIANEHVGPDGKSRKEDKFLIGTSEPSLLGYYSNKTLKEADLPIKLCGFSQCYRSEIGSYGKDTKGIYRVHEFMKVELVTIAPADIDLSDNIQQEMLEFSKELHEDLGLPYRVLQICTGDMGTGKYKMFDLEAWIPSRDGWGETGSASNLLDWQARRLNVKYKTKAGDSKFVYMLNDTALPSPRILISILENYQQADGSVKVPEVLVPFVGKEVITQKIR